MSVLFPLAALWALGRALTEKGRLWKVIAGAVIGAALLYATFTTAKAPAAMLVCMIVIMVLVHRRQPVPVHYMVFGALVVLAIPAALVASISDAGPLAVIGAMSRRLSLRPGRGFGVLF